MQVNEGLFLPTVQLTIDFLAIAHTQIMLSKNVIGWLGNHRIRAGNPPPFSRSSTDGVLSMLSGTPKELTERNHDFEVITGKLRSFGRSRSFSLEK
jgi:hypothetical protein